MGDHNKQPDLHQFDRWAADQQFKQEKSAMGGGQCAAPSLNKKGGGCQVSDFENHQLNDMVDMVKSANHEHLENAANGLWDARDAIWSAADELLEHIGRVDWHGEAATAFHSWAGDLVNHSYELGFYADNVATQVSAASMGLASVSSSMPPRDNRPKIFLPAEQAKLDPGGIQAQAVENHRQEAITQMNRLASYYAVSEGNLRGLEEPKFGKMPDMGVPTAGRSSFDGPDDGGGQVAPAHLPQGETTRRYSVAASDGPDVKGFDPGMKLPHVALPQEQHVHVDPTQHVGTNIDSVNTLPPDTVKPTVPVAPPTAPGPGGGGGGPITPFPTGPMVPTVGMPVPRGGTGGVRGPVGTSRMAVPPSRNRRSEPVRGAAPSVGCGSLSYLVRQERAVRRRRWAGPPWVSPPWARLRWAGARSVAASSAERPGPVACPASASVNRARPGRHAPVVSSAAGRPRPPRRASMAPGCRAARSSAASPRRVTRTPSSGPVSAE